MVAALLTGLGLAAPAGLNAYLPLLILALADRVSGGELLDNPYDFISSVPAILILTALLSVEIVADKIPKIDHLNDLLQSAARPPAGAFLMMASTADTDLNPVLALLLGLTAATAIHIAKTTGRPRMAGRQAGIFSPIVSVGEDLLAASSAITAIIFPWLVPFFLVAIGALVFWTRRGAKSGDASLKSAATQQDSPSESTAPK